MDACALKKRLREVLSKVLPRDKLMHVSNSYDIVGHIAIIRLTPVSEKYRHEIAGAIMDVHQNVKTVLAQASPIYGDFRIRKLEHVAGENRTVTTHVESGCVFSVDVAQCYFSPRLSYERMRIAGQIKYGEIVVNMFAGVGCFSLFIAKHSDASRVYSIDVNPVAIQFMCENVRINRAYGKVVPIFGDAREVIEKRLCGVADRVLMPLPERAFEYLPYALLALKKRGGWTHYYDFVHTKKDESAIEKAELKVSERLGDLGVAFEIPSSNIVRATGPNWYQVVLDIAVSPGEGKE
jgi:tRNA (guanine37-N1)-methyltransferase